MSASGLCPAPSTTTATVRRDFATFLRRPSTTHLLRGMVLANLALDAQLRSEGLLDAVESFALRREQSRAKSRTSSAVRRSLLEKGCELMSTTVQHLRGEEPVTPSELIRTMRNLRRAIERTEDPFTRTRWTLTALSRHLGMNGHAHLVRMLDGKSPMPLRYIAAMPREIRIEWSRLELADEGIEVTEASSLDETILLHTRGLTDAVARRMAQA